MTPVQKSILADLKANGGGYLNELAERLNMKPSGLGIALKRLVADGAVHETGGHYTAAGSIEDGQHKPVETPPSFDQLVKDLSSKIHIHRFDPDDEVNTRAGHLAKVGLATILKDLLQPIS